MVQSLLGFAQFIALVGELCHKKQGINGSKRIQQKTWNLGSQTRNFAVDQCQNDDISSLDRAVKLAKFRTDLPEEAMSMKYDEITAE